MVNAWRTRQRALRAIAEGRTPGKPGAATKHVTPEQRKQARHAKYARHRERNLERLRAEDRAKKKRLRVERAIAEGREPGRIGRVVQFTEAQRIAKYRANNLAYWKKNPEKRKFLAKSYYENNRETVLANSRNRRARKRRAAGKHTAADIRDLMTRQKGRCAFCLQRFGKETPHIDHYVPLVLGGSNDRGNLRLLHKTCNLIKGARHPAEHALRHGLLCW